MKSLHGLMPRSSQISTSAQVDVHRKTDRPGLRRNDLSRFAKTTRRRPRHNSLRQISRQRTLVNRTAFLVIAIIVGAMTSTAIAQKPIVYPAKGQTSQQKAKDD